jgi:hypothetical protein
MGCVTAAGSKSHQRLIPDTALYGGKLALADTLHSLAARPMAAWSENAIHPSLNGTLKPSYHFPASLLGGQQLHAHVLTQPLPGPQE